MVSILVLTFQQQSTTTGDNFHQLPVAIPVSSNNGSEESYGSRPGSRDSVHVGMGNSLPVSSSARIPADHMNGNLRGNAAGITGRILHILIICKLLTQVENSHQMAILIVESIFNRVKHCCNNLLCILVFSFLEWGGGDGGMALW